MSKSDMNASGSKNDLVKILLISVICVLNFFDAPEYVNCRHYDICEFLELKASLSSFQKAEYSPPVNHIQRLPFLIDIPIQTIRPSHKYSLENNLFTLQIQKILSCSIIIC